MDLNIFGKKALPVEEAKLSTEIFTNPQLQEALKGEVKIVEAKRHFQELGEEHPFDFSVAEGLYKKYGFITGVIDKYLDYVFGPGFYFEPCDEEPNKNVDKAQIIIDQFLKDTDARLEFRNWAKEALITGTGFMELGISGKGIDGLQTLDSKSMFVVRTDKNKITGFNQYTGDWNSNKFDKSKIIPFQPQQIAALSINDIGGAFYGLGKVYPALQFANNLICHEKNMNMLLERKANVPFDVTIGSLEHKRFPTSSDITAFGQKLEWLHNKHEWVHGPDVAIKTLDFGNIGDKFEFAIKHNSDMLFFTFQVPEVLMGRGSVPEGLAKVQMEAFLMNIKAIQDEIGIVVCKQIIRRVLLANGFDIEFEMKWGAPNNDQKNNRITLLNGMAGKFGFAMDSMIEKELVALLGFDESEFEALKEEEKEQDEEMKQMAAQQAGIDIPTPSKKTNNKERDKENKELLPKLPMKKKMNKAILKGVYAHAECDCDVCLKEDVNITEDIDYPLAEWLGFNYQGLIKFIIKAIALDKFEDLRAFTQEELDSGYLVKSQVRSVRNVMLQAFGEGKSVQWIKKELLKEKAIPHLYALSESGDYEKIMDKKYRAELIARTEASRLANKGNLDYLATNKIQEVRFISAESERTCEECSELNGKVFALDEAAGMIPLHPNCRCTFGGVTDLDHM
jgi:SPP1 gp7 family putative phage head morphogenesis protein